MPNLYLRKGGKNYYSPLVDVSNTRASDLIIRHGRKNYAVAKFTGTQVGTLECYDLCGNEWTVTGTSKMPTISSNVAKFDKSIYFPDGGWQSFTQIDSGDGVTLGGKDFTVDFWCLVVTKSSRYAGMFSVYDTLNSSSYRFDMAIGIGEGSVNETLAVRLNGGSNYDIKSSMNANVWEHYAIVYSHSSNEVKVYINGILIKTFTTISFPQHHYAHVRIGNINYTSNHYGFQGYIDEFRISDCARWTANFTPPTEQYTHDDNTLVLLRAS